MVSTHSRDRRIVLTALLLVTAIFLFFWIRHRIGSDATVPERPVFVRTVLPEQGSLADDLRIPGILEASRLVTVAPRVGGMLMSVAAEEGQMIREGDVLARIDTEVYELDLRAAESAWLLAESSFSRISRLHENAGASLQQLDEARANRDAAASSYELARLRLGYAEIRAPIDGMVLTRFFDAGNAASTDTPLFTIGAVDRLEVNCRIPEKHWDRFRDNRAVQVAFLRPDHPDEDGTEAILTRVSSSISPEDRCFLVTCEGDSGMSEWPVGARVSVRFRFQEYQGLWSLPSEALDAEGLLWWVDPADSRVKPLPVPAMPAGDFTGNRVPVPSEWADKAFVLDGQSSLREGQAVRIYNGETG